MSGVHYEWIEECSDKQAHVARESKPDEVQKNKLR